MLDNDDHEHAHAHVNSSSAITGMCSEDGQDEAPATRWVGREDGGGYGRGSGPEGEECSDGARSASSPSHGGGSSKEDRLGLQERQGGERDKSVDLWPHEEASEWGATQTESSDISDVARYLGIQRQAVAS